MGRKIDALDTRIPALKRLPQARPIKRFKPIHCCDQNLRP